MAKTEFEQFLADTLREDQGKLVPVKASLFERMFVKKADPEKLHPNPDDEFCDPEIGPNNEIVSEYVSRIAHSGPDDQPWEEPLIVEKVHPEGYMLLNGHHRWAAALRTGFSPVGISIVNVTQEVDIERMIQHSTHEKRVTLDLDEVAFCTGDQIPAEPPLPFPFKRIYKERIRQGIPALLLFLGRQGYDIWVYTAKYYSMEYLRGYLKRYSVKVDGIVTGAGHKTGRRDAEKKRTDAMLAEQYAETLHIDSNLVLRTRRGVKGFEEYPVEAEPADWSRAVMEIVKGLNPGEKEK